MNNSLCTKCGCDTGSRRRKYCPTCLPAVRKEVAIKALSHIKEDSRLEKIRSKSRTCLECGCEYNPTGPSQKHCKECQPIVNKRTQRKGQDNWRRRNGVKVGVGKGGLIKPGKEHPSYKNGISRYRDLVKSSKEPKCERCGKCIDYSKPHSWCAHHKDHDRTNNELDNLELLCKRCHQIEHECWNNLPSK